MGLKTIDISYCQSNIDWDKVKADGVQVAIIRNGYLDRTDTCFDKHVEGALKVGIAVGTYTYILSTTPEQAKQEALSTVARLEKYKGKITYPVFADIEDAKFMNNTLTRQQRTKILTTFLETVNTSGYYAAVYINPAWLENWIDKTAIEGKYDIWLAAWTGNPAVPTRYANNYKGITMWQWGVDRVAGISGDVDGDLSYVDYPARIAQCGKNFLKKVVAPPTESKKKITAKEKVINSIYIAEGTAAMRTNMLKTATLKSRVVKGDYYAFDRLYTVSDGTKWLRHAGQNLYSMLEDGQTLFTKKANYIPYKAAVNVNIRAKASKTADKIAVLNGGTIIYAFDKEPVKSGGYTWVKIIANGKIGYVAKEYLEAVN